MLLKSIVNSVLRVMKKEPLEIAKHPVGMKEIVEDFEISQTNNVENEEGVQIVGIVGFGGSGKTTLAKELYNGKTSSINHSSFLFDVRDDASRKVLHTKQKKLLEDFRIQTRSFDNVEDGKAIIRDRLKSSCVLIVLDDVDHEDQLDALLPPKERMGRGSLVIITTRDMEVLTKWGITSVYKIKPLQDLHAKQLFCWHAFLKPFPLQGFENLVKSFLNSCSGLPLSLKVIGGQLYRKKSREYWVSQLEKIQRILPSEILERLKVSYDALDEDEKKIFLDIACIFIRKRKWSAINIWEASGWSGIRSWETLENKCLVESYETFDGLLQIKYIRMHDHLRDLGRQIAKTHSPQQIRVDEGIPFRGITDSGDRRVKLERSGTEAIESTETWVELLRGVLWLEWEGFVYSSIPSWLPLDTIIVLEFHSPKYLTTLWEDAHPPLQLRELRIEYAQMLQSLPRSIGRLQHLKRLFLEGASRLSSLPEEFCELQFLERLDLGGCRGLLSLPNRFGDLVNLRHLYLNDCESLKRLPKSFKHLTDLQYLNLNGCESLETLDNIPNLKAICFVDRYFDHYFHKECPMGGEISLTLNTLEMLPIICQLSELKELKLEIPLGMIELPNLAGLISLTNLEVKCYNCSSELEGLEHLTLLENLIIWAMWNKPVIKSLPRLERLQTFSWRGGDISVFGDCIQNIEMENWPPEMTICGKIYFDFDSFTSPGVDVHPMREWSLIPETNLSNAIVVCYRVLQKQKEPYDLPCFVSMRKAKSTPVELPMTGKWIVISVFKEVPCLVEDIDGGLLSLDVSSGEEVEVLGGWVMVGETACILDGLKQLFQLFQTHSNESSTSSSFYETSTP